MFKQVWTNRVSLNYVNKVPRLLRNFIYVMTKSTNRVAWLSLCHNELSSVTAERRFYYFWFIFASSTFLPFNFIQFHSTSKIIWRRKHKNVSLKANFFADLSLFFYQAELYVKLTIKKSIQNFEKIKLVLEMFLRKQQIKISNMVLLLLYDFFNHKGKWLPMWKITNSSCDLYIFVQRWKNVPIVRNSTKAVNHHVKI